jgi:hypothetical protein
MIEVKRPSFKPTIEVLSLSLSLSLYIYIEREREREQTQIEFIATSLVLLELT